MSTTNGLEAAALRRNVANRTAHAVAAATDNTTVLVVGTVAYKPNGLTLGFVEKTNSSTTQDYIFGDKSATTVPEAVGISANGDIIVAGSANGSLPGGSVNSGVPAKRSSFVLALRSDLSQPTVRWSSRNVPGWKGVSYPTCLALHLSGDVFVGGYGFADGMRNLTAPAPVVFYITYNSSGAVTRTVFGQYGTPTDVLPLNDYQATDGPYIVGQESTGKFFVYKYSRLLRKVDRFLYPQPGASRRAALTPADAKLEVTDGSARDAARAMYIVGKNGTGASNMQLFVQKLGKGEKLKQFCSFKDMRTPGDHTNALMSLLVSVKRSLFVQGPVVNGQN